MNAPDAVDHHAHDHNHDDEVKVVEKEEEEEDEQAPTLFEGILDGNGTELSFLLRAVLQLLKLHHTHSITQVMNESYQQLADLVGQLDQGDVCWIDLEDPRYPHLRNPDAKALRQTIYAVAKTTLVNALLHCVAVQRRYVTGAIYGPGVSPELREAVTSNARVRWARYRPWPETDVEALVVYVHDHEQLSVAGVIETLEAAARWRHEVIPSIRQHYRSLEKKPEQTKEKETTNGGRV